jgi:transcriptional regulator with GAF, ATPase, and Fis domain
MAGPYLLKVDVAGGADNGAALAERACRALGRLGVRFDAGCADMLLLAHSAADAAEAIRAARLGGARRVLVAVEQPDSLRGRGVWEMLAAGADDVFCWSPSGSPADDIVSRLERWGEVDALLASELVAGNLVGTSTAFRRSLRELVEIGRFTDASVLLCGESGTGKELAARLIHALDPRRQKGDLVVVDCTTVVPSLSGSEFFGHERGAFTGAVAAREGAFARGAGGTVFLDEVGELPLELQAELLRVVQERAYKPIGSNSWRKTDFRLICATNRDLENDGAQGGFRRDFYYRIAEWTCSMPSLAERREDIEPLARHFLRSLAPGRSLEFEPPVLEFLQRRDYEGNVRELRQLVARFVHVHVGSGPITVGNIPVVERERMQGSPAFDPLTALDQAVDRAIGQGLSLREIIDATREAAIRGALAGENGSVRGAARRLHVTDRAIQLHRQRKTTA